MLPIQFCAESDGQYECRIIMKSGYDLRTVYVEATVSAKQRYTLIEFHSQAIQPLLQNIPLVCLHVRIFIHAAALRLHQWNSAHYVSMML